VATAGARYTTVSSEKWEDDWYLGLDVRARNLFDFLCEGAHGTFAGVFRLDPRVARFKTGPWRADKFEETLDVRFAGHVVRYPGNWWFVRTYLKWNGARDGKISENQATGLISIVKGAPKEARAHFWAEYGSLFTPHGITTDTLAIPYADPMPVPYHTIPDHTKPRESCRSRAKPRGLTDEQNAVKQAAIDYFYEKLQAHTGLDKPRFPGGRAANFFAGCIRDGYDERDFREVTDWFFDERIRGDHSSANFGHYQASFNAGCIAIQKRREEKR